MMAENNLLCSLLSKESTSGAVLWEPDLLLSPCTVIKSHPFLSVEAQMSGNNDDDQGRKKGDAYVGKSLTTSASDVPCQTISSIQAEKNACYSHSSTSDEDPVEDLDDDEDDLPVGMRIDSGALACVACGILGYPFMAVVQLSESARKDFFPVNYEQSPQNLANSSCPILPSFQPSGVCKLDQDITGSKLVERVNPVSSQKLSPECGEGKVSRDGTALLNNDVQLPNLLHGQTAKSGHGFCRPRIFCLQHALEIEQLLRSKGGTNVLIICHSDYIKIKAYATPVAEEVGMQFNFKDVPLENASPSELDLINIAISDEGHDEDWTSKVGMNLSFSVKLRNQSALKQRSMSVILGRMFSGNIPHSDFSKLKWHSRKSRTPYKVVGLSLSKSFTDVNIEKTKSVVRNTNADSTVKLQVYQSRKRKANAMAIKCFGQAGEGIQHGNGSSDGSGIIECKESYPNKKIDGNKSDELFSITVSAAEDLQTFEGSCVPVGASNSDKIIDSCRAEICSPNVKVPGVDISERHQETLSAEECGTRCNVGTCMISECQENIVELKSTNIEALQETGAAVETNSAYEFGSTSNSESEIMEGNLCSSLLPVDEPCDNAEVLPDVSHADKSSTIVERFSQREFGTECKFLNSEKSESQGIVSEPETKVSDLQLGAGAADVNISEHECHNSPDTSCASKTFQNISMSQDPDLDVSLGNPLLSYDNSEMQLKALGAAAQNNEVAIDQSSKLEPQRARNSSTVDECEVQQVEHPALEENKVQAGDGNSWLKNSSSGTSMPVATSSQLDQEILSMNWRTKVACDNAAVDNSSGNSARIIAISMVDKDETKTAGSLKRRSGYLNSADTITYVRRRYKRKREEEQVAEVQPSCSSFFRSPCEGLRPRSGQIAAAEPVNRKSVERKNATPSPAKRQNNDKDKKSYTCNVEGCRMRFRTKEEHRLHMKNRCTYKGCRKRFKSHKNTLQHQRVHLDERPLVCPWKGCGKSFKWAWARTEHIRLHTGERPYKCTVAGCELTFRFVSDFSRHRRITGHTVNSD